MLSPAEIEVTKSQAHALVDRVPPEQLDAVVRLLTSLVDEEPLTDDDYELFLECRASLANGEHGSSMAEVMADLGIQADDFRTQR